ncbi:WD repeat-containing protein 53, partial [Clydaea vesicula]
MKREKYEIPKNNKGQVLSLSINPSKKNILVGTEESNLYLFDIATKNLVNELNTTKKNEINFVKFKKENEILFSSGDAMNLLDLRENKKIHLLFKCEEEINSFDLDDELILSGDDDGNVNTFDLKNNKFLKLYKNHDNICSTVKFRPGGFGEAWSGGFDFNLYQQDYMNLRFLNSWDLNLIKFEEPSRKPFLNPAFINCMEFTKDGKNLCLGLGNGCINLMRLKKNKNFLKKKKLHEKKNSSTENFEFNTNLDTNNLKKQIFKMDCTPKQIPGHNWAITCLKFLETEKQNSQLLVTGSIDGNFGIWETFEDKEKLLKKFFLNTKFNCFDILE